MTLKVFHIVKVGLFALLATVAIFSLTGCDSLKKSYHYVFSFKAEVADEIFEFKTKVACDPYTGGGGQLFKYSTFYTPKPGSIGKRLADGRGFFVSIPNLCGWFRKEQGGYHWAFGDHIDIVPLMYTSDNYEDPKRIFILADGGGSSPNDGVRMVYSSIESMALGENEKIGEIPFEKNDPLNKDSGRWLGFALFPLRQRGEEGLDQKSLAATPDNRYELYLASEILETSEEAVYRGEFWSRLIGGSPLSMPAMPQHSATTPYQQKLEKGLSLIKVNYSQVLAVEMEKGIVLNPTIRGQIVLYPEKAFYENLHNPEGGGIRLGFLGTGTKAFGKGLRPENFFIVDNRLGETFLLEQFIFKRAYK